MQQLVDRVNGFHIEPTNLCTLKCPGCARTQFNNQWPQHWKNHNLDINQLFEFLDIDLAGKSILLCGNYGDPIYHPEFIKLVSEFKNRKAQIKIVTNGSYKTADWWNLLVECLDEDDTITFSIDGIPDNFVNYRVNADWDSIKLGIDICVSAACQVIWKYIPFKFNEATIDQAKQISESLGITRFFIEPSSRFDTTLEFLKPSEANISNLYTAQLSWKQGKEINSIDPQCANQDFHFVSADGYYSPCCRIADHRFYYKTIFGKHKQKYDIKNTTISSILNMPDVNTFLQNLDQHQVCRYSCPKTSCNQKN